MMQPRFILFGSLFLLCASQAYAMKCQLPMGLELSCPTLFNDEDKAFCCHSSENIPYCCDIADYIKNNSAIIAGILVGLIIILIVVVLCCCCFCSCCLLAKRRVQRGTVYGPVSHEPVVAPHSIIPPPVYTSNPYPLQSNMMVHTPPPTAQHPPPYPYNEYQPPVNPNYQG